MPDTTPKTLEEIIREVLERDLQKFEETITSRDNKEEKKNEEEVFRVITKKKVDNIVLEESNNISTEKKELAGSRAMFPEVKFLENKNKKSQVRK